MKGDLAVARAIFFFTEKGWDVSVPITESAAYDLVVDAPDGLKRVQVKFTSTGVVDLRRIHCNTNGSVVKPVVEDSFDWLYVYANDKDYLVRWCPIQSTIKMVDKYLEGPAWVRQPALKAAEG